MKFPAALLLLAAAAGAADRVPGPEWIDGLPAALKRAGEQNRLILLREVRCACDGASCPYRSIARDPAFLERISAQTLAARSFVAAVVHVRPDDDVAGLLHPKFLPTDFARGAVPLRTLIVTPTGHVIHRLDLCPDAADVEVELTFALRARAECFSDAWAPLPRWEERLRGFHAHHAARPDLWHAAPAASRPGSHALPGFNLELPWQPDLAAARAAAKERRRAIFFFQVVGDLHREGC